MTESTKMYLPMPNRQDYCVTKSEQTSLARRFEVDVSVVRSVIRLLQDDMRSGKVQPVKTATKAKRLIDDALNAAMQ